MGTDWSGAVRGAGPVLLVALLAQALLGYVGARAYLTDRNTLAANGRWSSTKTELERGLLGAWGFVHERQSLSGGRLNLGAWHGFQEVLWKDEIEELRSLEFDFELTRRGWIGAVLGRREGGESFHVVRFGGARNHASALLEAQPEGGWRLFNDLLDFGPDPNPGSSVSVFRLELDYLAASKELRIHLFDEGGADFLANTVSVDLSGFGPSHVGFSARTGGHAENHDVRSLGFSAAPTTKCTPLAANRSRAPPSTSKPRPALANSASSYRASGERVNAAGAAPRGKDSAWSAMSSEEAIQLDDMRAIDTAMMPGGRASRLICGEMKHRTD